jgi:hypothetical protein
MRHDVERRETFVEAAAISVSRLTLMQQEIDRVFGAGYAAEHPDVVSARQSPLRFSTRHRAAICG